MSLSWKSLARSSALCLAWLLILGGKAGAQAGAGSSLLTLDRLYSSQEFAPARYATGSWLPDGSGYLRVERRDGRAEIVAYDAPSGARRVIVPPDRLVPSGGDDPLRVRSFDWVGDGTSDGTTYLLTAGTGEAGPSSYWTLTLGSGRLHEVGGPDADRVTGARLSPDGRKVGYVLDHDLYAADLASGEVVRLTTDGSNTILNGTGTGVYSGLSTRGFRWSPDGRHIAFVRFDASGVPQFSIIDYTDSTYPIVRSASYVQPGDTMPAASVGIVDATGGPARWVDLPGDPRNNYVSALDWAPGSEALLVVQLNRLQDTARVFSADPASGGVHRIFLDGDDTWVEPRPIHWLEGGRSFTWVSERDGWRHVYRIPRDGGEARLLTPGDFDVLSVEALDRRAGWLYFVASPDDPTQRYLYRSRLDGRGRMERVTPKDLPGTNDYDIAPGGRWAWHTRSRFGVPPVTNLVSLPDHRRLRTVVDNDTLRREVTGLKRGDEDFFRVDIGGGVALDGWVMKPYDFDPDRKYPVLFYVYGMPAAQTVLDRWGGTQYLFHVLLTQLGYVVMSVDNRGTPAPRGRDWRKVIYLKHGVLPARDQAAAVRALEARWSWMDPSRIGIYGWSGGGNVSMNAIFRHPDVYSLAMPGAGLSSHRFYHASFTERFMGLPQDHPDAYEATAPINVAKNLRGHLLIIQGTGDSNVHFKSSAALENALIAAKKRFTIMPYPNRNHGMREGESTQWHLHDLYIWYLQRNMPSERNHEKATRHPSENSRNEP